MRSIRAMCGAAAVAAVMLGAAAPRADAQDPAAQQAIRDEIDQLKRDFEALKQQYGDRLTALEQKLAAMQSGQPPVAATQPSPNVPQPAVPPPIAPPPAQQPSAQVPPGAAGAGGPAGALPVYGAAATGSKVFNPDIAVIGDFLGGVGSNPVQPDPFAPPGAPPSALQMHESEASFQAVVDPYARADFFLSFGEEGVNLEEGFLTLTELPGGLMTKVGKMRAAFGKVNTLHNHVLPWTDRPLVMNNLLGGEDGINDAGLSVARLIPNPWIFLEATGQIFRGDSDEVFRASTRSDVSYVGHVRGYQDITENTNVDLGFSISRGHNAAGVVDNVDVGRFTTRLYGIDATVRWRPLSRAIYHSFIGRTEVVWSRRDQFNGVQASNGFYASADYQFARRWFAGVRFDGSDRADDATVRDTGQSVVLTYWPSEFSQVRGQYRRTAYGHGPTANEFLFQFQFSIGAHGAHPF